MANDLDARRVNNVLVGRLRKLHTPCILVTIGNAAKFPVLRAPDGCGTPVRFDRVLLDAPCSGDGTLRKEPSIWQSWKLHDGLQCHSTQLRLLVRGLTVLKDGGRLVYSTCSLNPLENEAVVMAAIARFKGGSESKARRNGRNPRLCFRLWIII